ncbi:hypothetical protein ACQ4WX_48180 [Streptomyces lasalocidi]
MAWATRWSGGGTTSGAGPQSKKAPSPALLVLGQPAQYQVVDAGQQHDVLKRREFVLEEGEQQ